jgi:hypothetical protein
MGMLQVQYAHFFYLCQKNLVVFQGNCLVGTRYLGFGTGDLDISCLKSSKCLLSPSESRIPNPD